MLQNKIQFREKNFNDNYINNFFYIGAPKLYLARVPKFHIPALVLTSGVGDVEVGRVVRLERVHLRPESTVRVEEGINPWAVAFVDI